MDTNVEISEVTDIFSLILICSVVLPDYKLEKPIKMCILIIFIEFQQYKQMISMELK